MFRPALISKLSRQFHQTKQIFVKETQSNIFQNLQLRIQPTLNNRLRENIRLITSSCIVNGRKNKPNSSTESGKNKCPQNPSTSVNTCPSFSGPSWSPNSPPKVNASTSNLLTKNYCPDSATSTIIESCPPQENEYFNVTKAPILPSDRYQYCMLGNFHGEEICSKKELLEYQSQYSFRSEMKECTPHNHKEMLNLKNVADMSNNIFLVEETIGNTFASIDAKDFTGLLDNLQYENDLIDLYLKRIADRSLNESALPNVGLIRSYAFDGAIMAGNDGRDITKLFSVPDASVYCYNDINHVLNCDIVFVPIRYKRHYVLLVYDFEMKRIVSFDPINTSVMPIQRFIDIVSSFINYAWKKHTNEIFDWKSWTYCNPRDSPQQGPNDCGPFICTFAEFYSRRIAMSFNKNDSKELRGRIFKAILLPFGINAPNSDN